MIVEHDCLVTHAEHLNQHKNKSVVCKTLQCCPGFIVSKYRRDGALRMAARCAIRHFNWHSKKPCCRYIYAHLCFFNLQWPILHNNVTSGRYDINRNDITNYSICSKVFFCNISYCCGYIIVHGDDPFNLIVLLVTKYNKSKQSSNHVTWIRIGTYFIDWKYTSIDWSK